MNARTWVGALALVFLAIVVFLAVSAWSRQSATAKPSVQPIAFNHQIHVQTYKIDCQYCHADARRSEYAGLPSVSRCMGCHKIVAADRPEIRKLAEYGATSRPIPWVRQYKVPEFVYFPHKPHIRAELKCQDCHGPVETMTTVGARTGPRLTNDLGNLAGLKPAPPPLSMGWCIECHQKQNATRKMKAPLERALRAAGDKSGVPLQVNRVGSMLTAFFCATPVTDYAGARRADTKLYGRYFHGMLERGVFLAPSQFEAAFVSLAHSEADLEQAGRAAMETLTGLR